jgi:NAD(P)-dependent dehydrogenase (short-subunit alcohol dehydrogenase family)
MSNAMYHDLLNVNLHGAFYTLRAAARHMRERAQAGDPGGSLVACGSLSIFHGLPSMEHYAAAKGALAAMIKGLEVELGPFGVRANMIAPAKMAAIARGRARLESGECRAYSPSVRVGAHRAINSGSSAPPLMGMRVGG